MKLKKVKFPHYSLEKNSCVTLNGVKCFALLFAMMLCLTACTSGLEDDYEEMYGYLVDAGDSPSSSVVYGTMTDSRDGQVYKTVTIGTQTWMAENLNYAYTGVPFDNGIVLSDSTSWCYDNAQSNCATYGRLYTWAAAVDSVAIYKKYGEECGFNKLCARFSASALAKEPVQGVCPQGWHLPSNDEWSVLYTNVGGVSYAGQKLKANTSLWFSSSGTDEYGFSVLPAGWRDGVGLFFGQGSFANFWSSTEDSSPSLLWIQDFDNVVLDNSDVFYGSSVRCLRDSPDQGDEGSSSSSESSSSETPKSPSEVKDDGYYSNSSNCPAGLTCKYATTTDYLNSSKIYGEFLDTRDGQVYKTVTIGTQTWMAQNLNYAPTNVSSMGEYAWSGCYNNESANCSKYGRLYTWAAAVDSVAIYKNYGEECGYGKSCTRFRATALATAPVRGICPQGWHLPTNEDWQKLVKPMATSVDGSSFYYGAGIELKTVDDWYLNSSKGTNASGFSALPAGIRYSNGSFYDPGYDARFWSASEGNDYYAYNLYLSYPNDYADLGIYYKDYAFSVRCLKDSNGDEGSSPSVTPDPVPGANSSSSEEDVAVVQTSGYYETNCPAGLNCNYITTDYLNSSKAYGEILDTRDGQVYKTVTIGTQTWMAQNLNYGDVESWCGGGSSSKEGDCSKYGRLYTWEVAMDKASCGYGTYCNNSYEGTQGICPAGWHLPSTAEWGTLFDNVGGTGTAGSELKSSSGWSSGNGTNSIGFAVLPAGYRYNYGSFDDAGDFAYFWSSTEDNIGGAIGWYFFYNDGYVDDRWSYKNYAFSVRCLKN